MVDSPCLPGLTGREAGAHIEEHPLTVEARQARGGSCLIIRKYIYEPIDGALSEY